uniref:HTH luxR-type domain-containing protein n=1 Tax=Heterorhabditis bacteriophora TaxID=37862 RepID=A0A1I7X9S4_HETBA
MGRASTLSLHERDQIKVLSTAGYTMKRIADVFKRSRKATKDVLTCALVLQKLRCGECWTSVPAFEEKKFSLVGSGGFHSYWRDLHKESRHFSTRSSEMELVTLLFFTYCISLSASNIPSVSTEINSNTILVLWGTRHGNRHPEDFLPQNPRTWGFEGNTELTAMPSFNLSYALTFLESEEAALNIINECKLTGSLQCFISLVDFKSNFARLQFRKNNPGNFGFRIYSTASMTYLTDKVQRSLDTHRLVQSAKEIHTEITLSVMKLMGIEKDELTTSAGFVIEIRVEIQILLDRLLIVYISSIQDIVQSRIPTIQALASLSNKIMPRSAPVEAAGLGWRTVTWPLRTGCGAE